MRGTLIRIFCKSMTIIQWSPMLNGRQKMRRLVRLDHGPTRLVEDALRFKIFEKLPALGFANACDILQAEAQPPRFAR